MNIIRPSHSILINSDPYKHIEKIGRICYKSENGITDTSAEPFVRRLYDSNHHAMLEHFRFIIEIGNMDYNILMNNEYCKKYITYTHDSITHRYIISASSRGLMDALNLVTNDNHSSARNTKRYVIKVLYKIILCIINHYGCDALFNVGTNICDNSSTVRIISDFDELSDYEYKKHAWYSIHFVCDRGVSHEMVRHRDASFAQESTRYCNYSKGKYGGELTVIEPQFWHKNSQKYDLWERDCERAESTYMAMLKLGATPQEARSVLPNSLKTEIVITAQVYEWIHIFNLRVLGTTGAPHPQIKEVMGPAFMEMMTNGYLRQLMPNNL